MSKKTERHVVQLNFDFCASVRLCEEYEKIAEKALTSPANTEHLMELKVWKLIPHTNLVFSVQGFITYSPNREDEVSKIFIFYFLVWWVLKDFYSHGSTSNFWCALKAKQVHFNWIIVKSSQKHVLVHSLKEIKNIMINCEAFWQQNQL